MCSTPSTYLTKEDKESVYEPAEDSFLLLDALEKDLLLLQQCNPLFCLEIGCGSGIIITFLAKLLGQSNSIYFCSDINPLATIITHRTAILNRVKVEPVLTDLACAFCPRLYHLIDVLIFNPPYVATPSNEISSTGLSASWAGGVRGREVIDRILPLIPLLLSETGLFYLIVVKENDPVEIEYIMAKNGFLMTVVLTRRAGPEHLSVLRFSRNKNYS